MTMSDQTPQIDVFSPAVRQDPYPVYAALRAKAPVYYDSSRNVWVVSRFAEAALVLKNQEAFSTRLTSFESTLLGADGAAHARLRRIVGRVFASQRLPGLEGRFRELVRPLIADMLARGRGELMEGLAQPVPLRLIAELLDIAPEHWDACRRWSNALTDAGQPFLTDTERSTITSSISECRVFFGEHVRRALAAELKGVFPDLVAPTADGHRLTAAELLDVCMLLVVAGNETITNLIGNAAQLLLCRPAIMRQFRQDMRLIPSFVEEVLRFESPVQRVTRVTKVPVELAGCRIPQDARVIVLIGSANRDEEKFPQADEFQMDRTPNGHIAFGLGPHFCLGAQLARIEAAIVLECLLQSAEPVLCRPGEPIAYRESFDLRGPRRLDVLVRGVTS